MVIFNRKGTAVAPQHQALFERFRKKELAKLQTIEKYTYDARSNSVPLHREVQDGFSHRGRLDWAAVNAHVRIDAAEIILDRLESFALQIRKRAPLVSSVVVTSDQWLTSLPDACAIDICKIRDELHDAFRGLSYVGMIEPAFYPRRRHPGITITGMVSWHAHLLFWDAQRETLGQAVAKINRGTTGPLYGVAPASLRRRSWNSAAECLCYLLKSPAKSYSTRRMPERIDPGTGEIIAEHDLQIPQKLRPGQHVHMRNALREFALDDLLLAGDKGYQMLTPLFHRVSFDRQRYDNLMVKTRVLYTPNASSRVLHLVLP